MKPINFIISLTIILLLLNVSCLAEGGKPLQRAKSSPVVSPAVESAGGGSVKVWVAFTDKGVFGEADLQKALATIELSERALKRRLKAGAALDFADLPVYQPYLEVVATITGSGPLQVSRWLNAATFEVDRTLLAAIAGEKFVAEIAPVARGERDWLKDWDAGVFWEGVEGLNEDYSAMGHEGAFYGNSYDQLEQIEVIQAHRRGYYGEGVLIAVLDGGFQLDHSALIHADVVDEWDFINNDGYTGYDPAQDVKGQPNHGTSCLSNIASYSPGNLIGCAPFASFMLGKSEDITDEEPVEEDNMVAAFEWFERNGVDIVSTSLSYEDWYVKADYDGRTCYATRAAEIAVEMGMMICTSQGNSGPDPSTLGAPGDAELVVGVGAVDSLGRLTRFSSRGPTADGRIKPNVLALGYHATIARPHTWNEYGLANGTSFSCPLAAGGIALVIQAHPDWAPWKILEAVENTATQATHPDNDYGYGILQVCKALDYPSISGYVRDSESGKALAGAEVLFKNKDTGAEGLVLTDESGFYLIPNLAEGRYEIRVKPAGGEPSEPREAQVPPDDKVDWGVGGE